VQQPTKREGAGAPGVVRFEPEPGMVVAGKYRVERVLGEGGMGIVVAATHLGLEQPVAIKFLHADAMGDKDAVERFLREAKVAAKIKSDHVARVHDVGSLEGGVPYIVMEHLVGTDLGDLIDVEGPLPIDEASEMALQACAALAEVHAAGIVHRDLKPSNLFVTRRADGSPDVKLLDFGISKISVAVHGSEDPALTATATIMGSPSYMSPEQLKSTKEVDARTDLWSLGAVLYEAVTGRPAFRGESVPQVCAMIASEDAARPSTLREGIPHELEQAILGCLAKKVEDRITLVDLARVLARVAPERASGLLGRIEATAAPGDGRPRRTWSSSAETLRRNDAGPPPASARAVPTESTVLRREQRRSRGRALIALAAIAGVGVVVGSWYTGKLRRADLRKDVVGASGAVESAASAVSAAASAVASAVASSLPPEFPAPPAPATSGSATAPEPQEETQEEPQEERPPHAAGAYAGAHGTARPATKPKPHPGAKPHHKTWHHTHPQ
jgi:eukaryotic-like serine/threonine-protein kinase